MTKLAKLLSLSESATEDELIAVVVAREVDQWISARLVSPESREFWTTALANDPAGTRKAVTSLQPRRRGVDPVDFVPSELG